MSNRQRKASSQGSDKAMFDKTRFDFDEQRIAERQPTYEDVSVNLLDETNLHDLQSLNDKLLPAEDEYSVERKLRQRANSQIITDQQQISQSNPIHHKFNYFPPQTVSNGKKGDAVFATGYGTVAALSPAKSDTNRSVINDTMQQLIIENGQIVF